jgi:hypothetical protein
VLSDFNTYRFDVGYRVQGEFMLQHTVWDKLLEIKWCLVNIYGAVQEENKDAFLRELASFCAKIKEPYVMGGDFNIMRFSSDKNKFFIPNRFSDIFNTIININDLRELYVSRGKYTWSNNQVNPTLEKLDRILMSREWEKFFPAVLAYKRPREFSNHNPIIMNSQFSTLSQSRSFKIELSWLEHPDFLVKVEEIWLAPTRDNSTLSRVLFKLKKVRKFLKGWGYNLSRSRKKRKKEIQETLQKLEEMEESSPLSGDLIRHRLEIKLELFKILDEEELYWFKRCHET